jgi:putative DNA primase/helicase
MSSDPFAPIGGPGPRKRPADTEQWEIIAPVPPGSRAAPKLHRGLGKPTATWTYTDGEGRLLGYVYRFDGPDGKEFRPLTLWRSNADGAIAWRWTSWATPRPLYRLQGLAQRPSAPVLVTEGEKACDAATRLLSAFAVVTNPNGAKSADKADWSPLRGRVVTIWPDNDAAGLAFAKSATKAILAAGASSVATIAPPQGVAVGWDAADALAAGWDEKRAAELVASATPAAGEGAPRYRRPRKRDDVIGAVINTEGVELWRDAGGATYITVPVGTHLENWSLRAFGFERWVSGLYYHKTGLALPAQALDDIRRTLDIKAYEDGREYEPFVRVGSYNGNIYLDLCDDAWRVAEVTPKGWRVTDRPPVKFLRPASARPLPEPQAGDLIELLRGFVNLENDDEFKLIVSWLVAALRPGSPFPILIVNGTQGTGKSVLCRVLRSLIDPDVAMICAAPKNEQDLVLAAANTWVSAFDNLSDVTGYLPDALCRLASGAGFRTRALHTNRDEAVFSVQRPILLNGIPTLTEQADVGRRSIVINLATIPPERRQAESDFWMEFNSVSGRILGALLDGVSRGLSAINTIQITQPGSMADFEKWSMAAASAFGWKAEEFQSAYRKNQTVVVDDTFEADAVAVAIRDFVISKHPDGWEGTPSALQVALDDATPESIRKSRSWPKTPNQLGNRVKRAKPLLEHKGFAVDRRHSGTRTIIIVPPEAARAPRQQTDWGLAAPQKE